MINRRNFLKLSLITAAGAIVPLTAIRKSEIGGGETISVKVETDKGDLFFVVPASVDLDLKDNKITWSNIGDITFTATQNCIVTGLYVMSPIQKGEWLKFDMFSNQRAMLKEDRMELSFNDSYLIA